MWSNGDQLMVTWDLAELLGLARPSVDVAEARRHLHGIDLYGRQTLFDGIYRLTERTEMTWTSSGLLWRMPEDSLTSVARPLERRDQVEDAYDSILQATLRRGIGVTADSACFEFSGGLDSANVVRAASAIWPKSIRTYGIIVPGQNGRQQRQRRLEFLSRGTCQDTPVEAAEARNLRRWSEDKVFSPYDEPYAEALDLALVEAAQDRSVVVTGIGGDELMSLAPWEKPKSSCTQSECTQKLMITMNAPPLDARGDDQQRHPSTLVPEPALLAVLTRAPVFMRRGLWPVNPLCTPELQRFCSWLPADLRQEKRLHRALLCSWGMDDSWLTPPLRENFTGVMTTALTRAFEKLRGRTPRVWVLEETGIVADSETLTTALRSSPSHLHSAQISYLYQLLNLEASLRRIYGMTSLLTN
jgi:asparagine synthase (glutamine-hydrolysing)